MPADIRLLRDIDRWIAAAYSELRTIRSRLDEIPSVEELVNCQSAEDRLNRLLDRRCAVARAEPAAPPVTRASVPAAPRRPGSEAAAG